LERGHHNAAGNFKAGSMTENWLEQGFWKAEDPPKAPGAGVAVEYLETFLWAKILL